MIAFDGTANFSNQFIAYNVHADTVSPSEYNNVLCALNADQGYIKSWNCGTGKVVHIENLSEEALSAFHGFKLHNIWDNHCLVSREEETS